MTGLRWDISEPTYWYMVPGRPGRQARHYWEIRYYSLYAFFMASTTVGSDHCTDSRSLPS